MLTLLLSLRTEYREFLWFAINENWCAPMSFRQWYLAGGGSEKVGDVYEIDTETNLITKL